MTTTKLLFFIVLLASVCLLLGRAYVTGNTIGGDAIYYYSNLRSIIIDKDVNFKNEYGYFHNQISNFTKNRKIPIIPSENPITKKLPNIYPIGTTLLLIPYFLFAHVLVIILQNLGLTLSSDGYNIIYQVTSSIGSLLYAFFGLLIVYDLGKRIFEPKIALIGTLSILLATPLIYYMTMEPLSSHSISFFCVSLFIYFWYISRKNRRFYQWLILGILGGIMSIVRYQDVLFLLIPIMDSLISKKLFKNLFPIYSFLLIATLVIIPQLLVNNFLYGSPFTTGYQGSAFPYLLSPKIFYSLFSLERGMLVWSPILIFSFIGLFWFIKKNHQIGGLLFFSFLIQLYTTSSWADPSQGDSFGNRILLNSSLIFALGIMQFLKDTLIYQKFFLGVFTLLIFLNGFLMSLFIFRIIGQPY